MYGPVLKLVFAGVLLITQKRLSRTRVMPSTKWTNFCPSPKMGTSYLPSELTSEAEI